MKTTGKLFVMLTIVSACYGQTALDAYGGATNLHCPNGPAKFFYTQKIGSRWWLCTPAGNVFWMKSVYNVSLGNQTLIAQKYGDTNVTWGPQQNRRLLAWGFNSTAEYSSSYVQPTTTNSAWPGGRQPVPMPFTPLIWPSYYALKNYGNFASAPVKDLVQPTKTSVYGGWRAHSPDIWDPNYKMWLANAIQKNWDVPQWLTGPNNDYMIGINVDDVDWLQGFGAGADFKTLANGGVMAGREQPHLSWIILITPPTQTGSSQFGLTYTDTTVYSKQALGNFLAARYGAITALNSAWNSNYTTFGTAGGWGVGTGLLDEDGTHTWIPKDYLRLTGGTAAFIQDMDDFLFQHAQKYFSDIKSVLATYAPGRLYLGPTTLGTWGAPPRRQILQAAAPYIDMMGVYTVPAGISDAQGRIDFIAQYLGDKPWFSWEGELANPDSALYAYPPPDTVAAQSTTQGARAQVYSSRTNVLVNTRTSAGIFPLVGFKLWDLVDSFGEKANWGLVSLRDNAYDGAEAIIAAGRDAWGYTTGGEDHNYGDFLTGVKAANAGVWQRLLGSTGTSPTTTSVTSSANPSASGQAVTFTANVVAASGTPTGTVQFMDGSSSLGSAALSTSGTAALTTASLGAGTHTITAVYSGDSSFNGSTSVALSQVVNAPSTASTTTSLSSSLNPSISGQAVTFTAVVSSASGTPGGSVQFMDGSSSLGSASLIGGSAAVTISTLTVGMHSISAIYTGNSSFSGSQSAVLSQTVNSQSKASSSTVVSSSLNPSLVGQSVTFRATVTAASGTPTGTVQFFDGSSSLGLAALSGGAAAITTSSLAAGSQSITAVYGGDSSFNGSTSAVLTQSVTSASNVTTTSVVSSVNPAYYGQSITFTAQVTAASGGTPTGYINFKDGTTTIGTSTLSVWGTAAFTPSWALSPGTHSITAVYSGSSSLAASTSSVLSETINKMATTVTLTSSVNPAAAGQSILFTATVTPVMTISSTPSASVAFYNGSTQIGTGTLNSSGVATFSTSTLPAGSDSITAKYVGDSKFAASTSSVLAEQVN